MNLRIASGFTTRPSRAQLALCLDSVFLFSLMVLHHKVHSLTGLRVLRATGAGVALQGTRHFRAPAGLGFAGRSPAFAARRSAFPVRTGLFHITTGVRPLITLTGSQPLISGNLVGCDNRILSEVSFRVCKTTVVRRLGDRLWHSTYIPISKLQRPSIGEESLVLIIHRDFNCAVG